MAVVLAAPRSGLAASWEIERHPVLIPASWPRPILSEPAAQAPLPFFVVAQTSPEARPSPPESASSPLPRGRVLAQADLGELIGARTRASLGLQLAGRLWNVGAAFDPRAGLVLLELSSEGRRRVWVPVWRLGESLSLAALSRLRKGVVVSLGEKAAYRFRLACHPFSFREPFSIEIEPASGGNGQRYSLSLGAAFGALGRGALAFEADGRRLLALCGPDADFKGRLLRDSATLLLLEPSSGGALAISVDKLARAPFEVRWGKLALRVELEEGRLVISELNSVK